MHQAHRASGFEWEGALDRLYDAVGRGDRLAEALGDFRHLFDARGVTFLTTPDIRDQSTTHIGAFGVSVPSLVEYHSHFNVHDEWVQAAQRRDALALGSVYRGSDLVSPEALRQTYFWQAFLSRWGVADILTAIVEPPAPAGPATFVSFMRHVDQPLFDAQQVPQLAELVPHLRRVLRLHRRLAPDLAIGATLRELLHSSDVATFFVGRDGRLVDTNPAGRRALAREGALLQLRQGRLAVRCDDGWENLGRRLQSFTPDSAPAFELGLLGADGGTATLEVRSVQAALDDRFAQHPVAALCTLRSDPPDPVASWQRRFGLTDKEALVASHLAQGRSLQQIAQALGLRITTVRTHLAALLGKTGTRRQAELVALLVAMPVSRGH